MNVPTGSSQAAVGSGSLLMKIAVHSYDAEKLSVHTQWLTGTLALHTTEHDLAITIDAPDDAFKESVSLLLLIAPFDSQPRELTGDAWQISCGQPLGVQAFRDWAEEVARLLTKLLSEQGLVCLDFVDLKLLLKQGKSRQLTCLLCDWADTAQLPLPIKVAGFSNALAAVFAPAARLNVTLFGIAGELLELGMPADGMLLLAGRLQTASIPRMLVMGFPLN